MSETDKANSSYFDAVPQEEVPADTTDISEPTPPISLPPKSPLRPAAKPLRPRLLDDNRSKSAFAVLQSRLHTNVIREDVYAQDPIPPGSAPSTSTRDSLFIQSRPGLSRLGRSQYTPRPLTSETSSASQVSKSTQSSAQTASQSELQGLSYVSRWKSSFPEVVKHRRTTSSNESPGTAKSEQSRSLNTFHSNSLQPLRPPLVRTGLSPSRSNPNIRIEKSFTMAEPADSHSVSSKETMLTRVSRRSSLVNPRLLLSSSVALFRKKRGASKRPSKDLVVETRCSSESAGERINHSTSSGRGETATGLKRVSSLLKDVKVVRHGERASSLGSLSSGKSRSIGSGRSCDLLKCSNMLERVESMQMALDNTSQSSSIRKLRMGITPHNTPEEQATYIAMNQNNELEEFFKIDISVRGQTSYLPSEARRIHTPPIPSEGPDGRKRGFFFDYDIVKDIERRKSQKHDGPLVLTKTTSPRSRASGSSGASRVPTISQGFGIGLLKRRTRVKTGDWYGTQLAELDSLPDSTHIHALPQRIHPQLGPHPLASGNAQQRSPHEEQLDCNIPEHLPTSPLCPRHPRYWRVVKKKGSQFRGC